MKLPIQKSSKYGEGKKMQTITYTNKKGAIVTRQQEVGEKQKEIKVDVEKVNGDYYIKYGDFEGIVIFEQKNEKVYSGDEPEVEFDHIEWAYEDSPPEEEVRQVEKLVEKQLDNLEYDFNLQKRKG